MSNWRPIAELDRSIMQFVLTHQDGEQRTMLWNPHKNAWEHPFPFGAIARGYEPDSWMELPDNPTPPERTTLP